MLRRRTYLHSEILKHMVEPRMYAPRRASSKMKDLDQDQGVNHCIFIRLR
jgi:hypothetical protein